MRVHLIVSLALICGLSTAYLNNPFSNTYSIQSSGQQAVPVSSNLPNYTYTAPAPAPAPVQVQLPAPVAVNTAPAAPAHTHAPVAQHNHAPAAPAPAPAPFALPSPVPQVNPALNQLLTMPQIMSYLVGPYGPAIGNQFSTDTSNHLVRCKSYCDTLPASPACDSANTLYRNACEAKCISRTVSTDNLRYGMCCCDDTTFEYDEVKIVHSAGATAGTNLCLTSCIFNCLGGSSEIEDEHTDDSLDMVQNTGNSCNALA